MADNDLASILASLSRGGYVDALMRPPPNPADPSPVLNAMHGAFVQPVKDAWSAVSGRMTPEEQQDMAFQAAAGLVPMARGLKPVAKGIRAYHVSPHDYERPDISKIGTGQGAQSYGDGLYGAGSKAVRDHYWDEFAAKMGLHSSSPEYLAARMNYLKEGDTAAAVAELENRMKGATVPLSRTNLPAATDILQSGKIPGPRTYEWNINARPEELLDWDKPIWKQPVAEKIFGVAPELRGYADNIKRAAESGLSDLDPVATGASIYRRIAMSERNPALGAANMPDYASDALRDAGIPGIKYLDQGSRSRATPFYSKETGNWFAPGSSKSYKTAEEAEGAVSGTRNYVLFRDDIIDILKKYGVAGLMAAPAMTGGADNNDMARALNGAR